MRKKTFRYMTFIFCLLALWIQAIAPAQSGGFPPIEAPLVRQGDFAVALGAALALGKAGDEVGAETRLGDAGIRPQNGWIADYPVTPDIIGELQNALIDAVKSGNLSVGMDDALKKFHDVKAELGLPVKPYMDGKSPDGKPYVSDRYPNPAEIDDHYYKTGAPVVTYYSPPPDYCYLYAWIPYPFCFSESCFSGFFILQDFHRNVIVNKKAAFVSNRFNDVRDNKVYRIDPAARFKGGSFAGIGLSPKLRSSSRHGQIAGPPSRANEELTPRTHMDTEKKRIASLLMMFGIVSKAGCK